MARVSHRTPDRRTEQEQLPSALEGGYLTDGRALFHVERTLLDEGSGDLLVELEDCSTLELIVCSAQSVAQLGMRGVTPLTPTVA